MLVQVYASKILHELGEELRAVNLEKDRTLLHHGFFLHHSEVCRRMLSMMNLAEICDFTEIFRCHRKSVSQQLHH